MKRPTTAVLLMGDACRQPRKVVRWALPLLLCLVFGACNAPRKACRKADRLVTKAVYICPDILSVKKDTVYVQLPADTVQAEGRVVDTNVDSLLAACDSLRAAAETIALNSINQAEDLHSQMRRSAAVNAALRNLRSEACAPDTLTLRHADATATCWLDRTTGALVGVLETHCRAVPCPQVKMEVNPGHATITGVATWYRTGFWSLLLLLLALLLPRLLRLFKNLIGHGL